MFADSFDGVISTCTWNLYLYTLELSIKLIHEKNECPAKYNGYTVQRTHSNNCIKKLSTSTNKLQKNVRFNQNLLIQYWFFCNKLLIAVDPNWVDALNTSDVKG